MVLVTLAVVFAAVPAVAQEGGPSGPKPKVLMLPTQGVQDAITSIVPERIGELSRKGVRDEGRVALMPTYEEIQQQLNAQGQSSAAVAQAQELYVSGIGLLTAGEDKKAVETFQRAVDIMEQNLVDLSDFGLLSDTLVNLALAYHNAEFDLDARKTMKAYAHLKQDKVLDPEKYPEELIEIYRDEVKKIVKGGPGRLTITSSVEGATVLIDGVEKGQTPLEVDDVGFGEHYLVVKHPSAGTWTEKIRVRGRKKKQTFEAKLAGAGAGAQAAEQKEKTGGYYNDLLAILATGRFTAEELQPYFSELTTQTGAEYVTWILMFKEGGEYVAAPFVYRTEDQRFIATDRTSFNIELSNLRAGVSAIATSIVDGVIQMPEDAVFESIELVEQRDPVVVAKPDPEPTTTTAAAATGTGAASAYKTGSPIQPPPDAPPSQGTSTWTYIAYGGAVLAAGALIAGGIILFADGGSSAPGFNTEVSW
jgi:hypothetical protein